MFDSLDGIVARMNKRCSNFGDFLDHFCDRVVDIAILLGLAFSTQATTALGLISIIIILLNNYQGTQIQASFGKRLYHGGGKAELFAGLVVFSLFMTFFPDITIRAAGKSVSPTNLVFITLGLVSIISIFYRFYYVYQLYRKSNQ
jgi:phosphatidylglycerophosphate synthase